MAAAPRILVIGLGNDFRSDDRVGLYVARRVEAAGRPGVGVMIGVADALDLLDLWNRADFVILVDCAVSGREAGTVHRFDALREPIPEDLFCRYSTHAFSVVDALALTAAMGQMPPQLIVFGIEADTCAPGTEMSLPVEQAAEHVIGRIWTEIDAFVETR